MTPTVRPSGPTEARADPHEPEEVSEAEFVHTLRKAVVVGVPAVFVLLVAMMLLAAGGEAGFVLGAMWPAVVGGPFFAGFAYLSMDQARHERAHHHGAPAGVGRVAH